MKSALLFTGLVLCISLRAERTIPLVPFEVNLTSDFSQLVGISPDDEIGFRVTYSTTLINLSKKEQTGSLGIITPRSTLEFAYARAGSGSSLRGMDFYYDLCGNLSRAYQRVEGSAQNSSLSPIEPAQFKIASESSLVVTSSFYFVGQYGNSASPKRFSSVNAMIRPIYKIVVNESYGAVVASTTVDTGPLVGQAASASFCSGLTISGPRRTGTLPAQNIAPPLLVNGGRPF